MEHQERRTVVRSRVQGVEACHLQGLTRPFPNHFHPYYVLGVMERGSRRLFCRGLDYDLQPGSLVLLAPGDSHSCIQTGGAMDYRSFHLCGESLRAVTGSCELPGFSVPAAEDREAAHLLRELHESFLRGGAPDSLGILLDLLFHRYKAPEILPSRREEVQWACGYLERHFPERISLETLCRRTGLSKSTLLRSFVREKGVTPYQYLESVRVEAARQLLSQGTPPLETALQTGFSDQSHLTNCFRRLTGLPPGLYRTASVKSSDPGGSPVHPF